MVAASLRYTMTEQPDREKPIARPPGWTVDSNSRGSSPLD
jgi:hypothetical protein